MLSGGSLEGATEGIQPMDEFSGSCGSLRFDRSGLISVPVGAASGRIGGQWNASELIGVSASGGAARGSGWSPCFGRTRGLSHTLALEGTSRILLMTARVRCQCIFVEWGIDGSPKSVCTTQDPHARVGRLLGLGTRLPPPPPPPGPPGPLSYQGSMATGHTYGGAEGARKFFSFPLPT